MSRRAKQAPLLNIDLRCEQCGSWDHDYEAWASANLPDNLSEGGGEHFCNSCQTHGVSSFYGENEEDLSQARERWAQYRRENQMPTVEEEDAQFLPALRESIQRTRGMAAKAEQEYFRLTGAGVGR